MNGEISIPAFLKHTHGGMYSFVKLKTLTAYNDLGIKNNFLDCMIVRKPQNLANKKGQ